MAYKQNATRKKVMVPTEARRGSPPIEQKSVFPTAEALDLVVVFVVIFILSHLVSIHL